MAMSGVGVLKSGPVLEGSAAGMATAAPRMEAAEKRVEDRIVTVYGKGIDEELDRGQGVLLGDYKLPLLSFTPGETAIWEVPR